MFFLSPEINWVFLGNRQQSNARAGQKKTHVFSLVMRSLNLLWSNVLCISKKIKKRQCKLEENKSAERNIRVQIFSIRLASLCKNKLLTPNDARRKENVIGVCSISLFLTFVYMKNETLSILIPS